MTKFRAYRSTTQPIATCSLTKVQLDTESYDTGSMFDNATNYRFTPTVAGEYSVTCQVTFAFSTGDTATDFAVEIYKNGSVVAQNQSINTVASMDHGICVTDVIDMNGSTDYIEMYCYQASGGDRYIKGTSHQTFMTGHLIP